MYLTVPGCLLNSLSTLKVMHGLGAVALFLEEESVLEERVGHEVGVHLQLPSLGNDELETLLGLERGLHVLQTHGLNQVDQAQVLRVVFPGTL